ncbi:MAG: CDP-diacylglycerol--serine O-phosphatidyltransferase [Gammaproteobacteria bacterium]
MTQEIKVPVARLRGIYLLPNLFTTTALLAGFYAIVGAIRGHFDAAATALFIAMVMDFLDGRVARLTNTQTPFGSEYDSLSDMVSFGLAPSILMFQYSLIHLSKFGWMVSFIYTATVALRLARFNTQVLHLDKRYFQGLPCPAGAAIIAALVWFNGDHPDFNQFENILFAIVTLLVATLMVSNIRYHSFKEIDLRGRVPFMTLIVIVLVFAAITLDPPSVLLFLFVLYGVSGPTLTLIHLRKARLERKKHRLE